MSPPRPPATKPRPAWEDSPAAWFAALERAIRTGDAALEERARRELRRLGVDVLIDSHRWPKREGAASE